MSHVNVTTKVDQKTYRMVKVVAGFTDQTMSEFIADVVKRAVDDFDYEQAILENTVYHDTDSMVDSDSNNGNDLNSDHYHDANGNCYGVDGVRHDDAQEVDNDTDNDGDDVQETDNVDTASDVGNDDGNDSDFGYDHA